MVFGGQHEDGGYAAGAALLFDQFKQVQVVGLKHEDASGRRQAGMWVWDRPDEPLPVAGGVARVFVGKTVDGSATVELKDALGRVRVRLAVSPQGNPRLELFDESGEVTASLPDSNGSLNGGS